MHLLKKIILAVLFMTAAYAVFAQEISMEELINMCNFPATKIDSPVKNRYVFTAKNFYSAPEK